MNKLNSINNIKKLSNAKGISGFEDEVVNIVKGLTIDLGSNKEDSMRNLYVYSNGNIGNRPIVQLDAHTDEVGFVVQAIKPNGLIRFINVGSWVAHNIPAHKVLVRNKFGKYITGIVSSTPPHFMSEAQKKQPLDLSSLYIDVGARSDVEAKNEFGIRIGEPIVPMVECSYDEQNDLLMGKAFDCRIGCAAIVDTLEELKGKKLNVDIVSTFSSQEEVGTRGSKLNSQHTNADIAIVFEGCPADDNFAEPYMVQTALKKGPMLRHIDVSMITNPRFQRFVLDIAEEKGIPVQESVRSGGGTNGSAIHISNRGVPCIVMGIPVRYAHTHNGISTYFDYECAVKLAVEIVERLDKKIIESF